MDFALAGDSTMTSDLLIASLHFRLLSVPAADLPVRPMPATLLNQRQAICCARSPAISERYHAMPQLSKPAGCVTSASTRVKHQTRLIPGGREIRMGGDITYVNDGEPVPRRSLHPPHVVLARKLTDVIVQLKLKQGRKYFSRSHLPLKLFE